MKRKIKAETFICNTVDNMDKAIEGYYQRYEVIDVKINVVDGNMNEKVLFCTVIYLSNVFTN